MTRLPVWDLVGPLPGVHYLLYGRVRRGEATSLVTSYVSTNPINEDCTLMASFGSLSLYLLIPYKKVITCKCFNIFWENMTFSNHHSYPGPFKGKF